MQTSKERLYGQTCSDIQKMSKDDMQDLINTLQLQQVELKEKNQELRQSLQELQESSDKYFQLHDFAPAGYLIINARGVIIDSNAAANSLLNMNKTRINGNKIFDIIAIDDQDIYFMHIQRLRATKTRQACEIRMQKISGDYIYCKMESNIATDKHGNIIQYSVFLDVSESKLAEKDLKKIVLALTKSNTQLERFAYVASHDLREPLRNISSCTQLLDIKYSAALDTEGKALIRYTNQSVQQVNTMISDLLTYSRNGNEIRAYNAVDCNLILQNVLNNLRQLIAESGAIITFDDLPLITANNTQIIQLFQNIISNGIKHNDNNHVKIHVAAQKQENSWLFAIHDNGPGIENQYLDKIFEIFTRLDSRSRYYGTGIGLAICKQVVENHRGNIWAESSLGKGSVFYFNLPEINA